MKASKNKKKMWVKKSNDHRGIKIQSIDEFDLNSKGTFVQEYVDKPFLINKRKFDIGVYVCIFYIYYLKFITFIFIITGNININ